MESRPKMLSINQCILGSLYRLNSRNLGIGVYSTEEQGFIGIRTKFGSRFLDIETHWDTGAQHGTAKPIEYLEDLPKNIGVYHVTKPMDRDTNRQVVFDMSPAAKEVEEGSRAGKWVFVIPREGDEDLEIHPEVGGNDKLFEWLQEKEKEYETE